MDIIQGIIIGIVQGLTEFLPVSSSAHLVFIQNILGVESSLAFDTFLHLGTLIAVLWFFRYDVYDMLKTCWLSRGDNLQG
jgi:undecaprenyl-diphosphatase